MIELALVQTCRLCGETLAGAAVSLELNGCPIADGVQTLKAA